MGHKDLTRINLVYMGQFYTYKFSIFGHKDFTHINSAFLVHKDLRV